MNIVVSPNLAVLVFSAVFICGLVGTGVTAAKGRVGWACIGLLTGCLSGLLTGFLIATPESVWARAFYRGEKLAIARRKFPPRRMRQDHR